MLNHFIGKIFGRALGCPCQEELFDFALDGMDPSQQDKVRKHLADCPPCAEQVKDYAWVSEGIALTAPQIDPPSGLCDKVKRRIRAETAAAPLSPPGRDPLAGWPRFWMRLGPVFAVSSLMMTALAFIAVFNRPASQAPADMRAASQILSSPSMLQVSLNGEGEARAVKGALFAAPGVDQVLLKVQGLKPCSRHGAYSLWACPRGQKPSRLGSFQAVDGRCAYVLSLARPFEASARSLEFEVTQEEPAGASSPDAAPEKGPTRLRGRYNL